MRIQLRAPGLALSACRSLPRLPSPTDPADGCCDPNPELHGRSPGWEARQRRVDHPVPQILAVGPCHARPPSNTGRATRILRLKQEPPPDSEKTERALAEAGRSSCDRACPFHSSLRLRPISLHQTNVVAALTHTGLAWNPLGSTGRSLGLTRGDVGLSVRNQVRITSHPLSVRACPSILSSGSSPGRCGRRTLNSRDALIGLAASNK
jgi:hypothetical protein